jgi:hypothetical protein
MNDEAIDLAGAQARSRMCLDVGPPQAGMSGRISRGPAMHEMRNLSQLHIGTPMATTQPLMFTALYRITSAAAVIPFAIACIFHSPLTVRLLADLMPLPAIFSAWL